MKSTGSKPVCNPWDSNIKQGEKSSSEKHVQDDQEDQAGKRCTVCVKMEVGFWKQSEESL